MKWTNKGHELDDIGSKYLKTENIYIWGAGKQGKRLINTLQWLKIDSDCNIWFIDSNAFMYGKTYENAKILSPAQFFQVYDSSNSVLTFCCEAVYFDVLNEYAEHIPDRFFIAYAERLPRHDFLRCFVSVYLMYKHDKLLSHHSNYIITSVCNLNCFGCLNFNKYISKPAHESFDSFKKHIDIVFSKFDFLASFHFSGGEVMLNRELSNCLEYISETYGDRIFELFFVTNGTIIPNHELLRTMVKTKCGVLLDDYRASVPITKTTFPKIKQLLDKNGIWHNIAKAEYWYELGITDEETGLELPIDTLQKQHNECNVHYFQDFFDGKIFGCCYIGYANDMYENKANIYTPDESNDYISIKDTPKMEILEFRFGYTNKGYYDLCRRCNEMHGEKSIHIPVAKQAERSFDEG